MTKKLAAIAALLLVPGVLSVADTIKLEYDFRLTPATKTP